MMDSQSQLFTVIPPAPGRQSIINEKGKGPESIPQSHGQRVREVHVTGTAEVCCPADRVSVRLRMGTSKESVSEATNSVSRRLDYILQSIRWKHAGKQALFLCCGDTVTVQKVNVRSWAYLQRSTVARIGQKQGMMRLLVFSFRVFLGWISSKRTYVRCIISHLVCTLSHRVKGLYFNSSRHLLQC